jgi:protease-4
MNNFIKQTLASLIGSLLGLSIFSGVSFLGLLFLVIAATSSQSTEPQVKDQSMLVFDLSVKITETQPSYTEVLEKTLTGAGEEQITLRQLIGALEQAAEDQRIVGIYINVSESSKLSSLGYASLREIRQALEKFRASGKKIIAYGVGWSEREYYLSSVADKIFLNPVGMMEINGLSSQPIFLTGALQKYGIGVQVVRVGKFKGAVEPLVLDKLSPENREQTQQLLDDLWGEWRNSVGKSRKISPEILQKIANNQGVLEAKDAKDNGLIDEVAYTDQVVADLKKIGTSDNDGKSFRHIQINDYVQASEIEEQQNSQNKIAVVYAEGEIVDGEGESSQIGGDRYARILRKIRQDQDIKSVVLRINSPGGSATASEIIEREIQLTKQVKPVIVSMGDVAASGGYWIASNSDHIFAEPGTLTGSIGVFGVLLNGQKLANNNGITWDTVKTSEFADSQTVSRPKSAQELAIYQRSVNRIYNMFINKVVQGRKLPETKVGEIAQGRVWSGATAKEIGLVDEIGGLNIAIEYAANKAKLGKDWQVEEYPEVTTLGERFFGRKLEETIIGIHNRDIGQTNPLIAELEKVRKETTIFRIMNDPQGIYARLPFNFNID